MSMDSLKKQAKPKTQKTQILFLAQDPNGGAMKYKVATFTLFLGQIYKCYKLQMYKYMPYFLLQQN